MSADLRQIAERLEVALIDQLGGEQVRAWCESLYAEGRAVRDIAADAGVSKSTVARRCDRMRAALAGYGLLPPAWTRRPPGPREREVVPCFRDNSSRGAA